MDDLAAGPGAYRGHHGRKIQAGRSVFQAGVIADGRRRLYRDAARGQVVLDGRSGGWPALMPDAQRK